MSYAIIERERTCSVEKLFEKQSDAGDGVGEYDPHHFAAETNNLCIINAWTSSEEESLAQPFARVNKPTGLCHLTGCLRWQTVFGYSFIRHLAASSPLIPSGRPY